MIAIYIVLGIIIGVVGITIIGFQLSKKDNQKFDTSDNVKSKSSIYIPEDDIMTNTTDNMWKSQTTTVTTFGNTRKKKREKTLEEQLKDALDIEDYEKAAELRDKINKQKTK